MSVRSRVLVIAVLATACSNRQRELRPGESVASRIPPGTSRSYPVLIPSGRLARFVCKQVEADVALRIGNSSANMTEWGDEILYARGGAKPMELVVSADSGEPLEGRFELRYELVPETLSTAADAIGAQNLDSEGVRLFEQRKAESLGPAEKAFSDAVTRWARVGDKIRQAQSLMMLGAVLEKPGRFFEADRAYVAALEFFASTGDRAAWLAARKRWINLGGGLGEIRGNDADLRALLTGWKQLGDRRGIHWISTQLASRLPGAERLALLEQSLGLARNMGGIHWEIRSLEKIGEVYHDQRRYGEALRVAQQLLVIQRRRRNGPGEAASLESVALNLAELGDLHTAIQALERVRDLRRRQGDLGAQLAATDQLVGAAIRLGNSEAALKYIDEARATADQLEAGHRLPSQHWGYRFSVAMDLGSISTSKAVRDAAFALLDSHRARFSSGSSRPRLPDLAAMLPKDATVIEHGALHEEGTGSAWSLDRTGVQRHELPLGTLPMARKFTDAARGEAAIEPHVGRELSKRLLGPIKASIKDRRIFVVPDERMADLPIGLLPDPNFTDGSILADHHEIVYLDSAHARLAARERPRKPASLEMALVTDPIHNRFDPRSGMGQVAPVKPIWLEIARSAGALDGKQTLPRLTGAAREKAVITSLLKPDSLRILEGADVDRDRIVEALREAKIVHFTVHGLIDWSAPHKSGLVLSQFGRGGASMNGYLGFDEIAQLKTDAELVVLAACQTAVGRPMSLHGVPSIATAFLRAGALRVLASLWKVNDHATAELMAAFYQGLLGPERLPPAEALRRAQFKLRNGSEWQHPKFWSGFILIGDWDPLP